MQDSKKILAVASAGGHWTQLMLISNAFTNFDVHYATTDINKSALELDPKISSVPDADLSKKFKLLPLALQMFLIVFKSQPNIVISTGAAPGFFAVLAGKLIGAKTIWVDSLANYSTLSVSGQYASKFCDLCLTQWPNLADDKKVEYFGSLL